MQNCPKPSIRCMYQWYKRASVCYAYLSDVASLGFDFAQSRWFARGWTLQELIAPSSLRFFGRNWCYLGSKKRHLSLLSKITGIDVAVLDGKDPSMCSVSRRMSWASERQTTRAEDIAYCLMGLFDVKHAFTLWRGRQGLRQTSTRDYEGLR